MYDSGLSVPDLTNAASYAGAQHHGQHQLDTILRDTAIIYALAWLWRRLTRPSSTRTHRTHSSAGPKQAMRRA